jgi:hypothetical protein
MITDLGNERRRKGENDILKGYAKAIYKISYFQLTLLRCLALFAQGYEFSEYFFQLEDLSARLLCVDLLLVL